ncbi:sarcosine oxidase subunit gamma [Thalassovita taeanensis]|uniref:Sarcosine oxidase subunit gamma n=1 Tax=Thalassovita taeanensis TaxID=657014 RepID=A0A1H9JTI4_9RHOB|nr:sarcosine oxidase subunit gamma [Thalassovita taeanensis]SEQ90149.1 sarcosine oxidase subunit gamma [Thalassovita taeanensis]
MADLTAKTPCAGLLPLSIGTLTLTEVDPGHMTAVAPLKGQTSALSEALKTAHGMALPAPNRATGKDGARTIWFGHAHSLLIGPAPDPSLAQYAALTDQSDAWAVVRLEGPGAADVLARLTPLDLRAPQFKRGHTARTDLMHMMASITRTGPQAFQIMVFRSMAHTLVHDLKTAIEAVTARAG